MPASLQAYLARSDVHYDEMPMQLEDREFPKYNMQITSQLAVLDQVFYLFVTPMGSRVIPVAIKMLLGASEMNFVSDYCKDTPRPFGHPFTPARHIVVAAEVLDSNSIYFELPNSKFLRLSTIDYLNVSHALPLSGIVTCTVERNICDEIQEGRRLVFGESKISWSALRECPSNPEKPADEE